MMESRGASTLPSTSTRLTEKDDALKGALCKLPAGERVALVRQQADEAAIIHGFIKDNGLSTLNNRTVYRGTDGKIYSLDTQHGEFELINSRTGQHEGAVQLFGLTRTKAADTTGRHDLRMK
jgi:filamentous hemagglutinin